MRIKIEVVGSVKDEVNSAVESRGGALPHVWLSEGPTSPAGINDTTQRDLHGSNDGWLPRSNDGVPTCRRPFPPDAMVCSCVVERRIDTWIRIPSYFWPQRFNVSRSLILMCSIVQAPKEARSYMPRYLTSFQAPCKTYFIAPCTDFSTR